MMKLENDIFELIDVIDKCTSDNFVIKVENPWLKENCCDIEMKRFDDKIESYQSMDYNIDTLTSWPTRTDSRRLWVITTKNGSCLHGGYGADWLMTSRYA